MQKSEKVKVIDDIILMACDGKTVKEIAETLNVNEKAVEAVVSRLDITRF